MPAICKTSYILSPRRPLLSFYIARSASTHATTSETSSLPSTPQNTGKKKGDISSAFVSLSGEAAKPLPPRFRAIKQSLISGREEQLRSSFFRLLGVLRSEIPEIQSRGSPVIPEINFSELDSPSTSFLSEHHRTGVALIRNVVSESQALEWLDSTKAYITANPSTKAFPANKPAVYELYWSPAQVQARAYPNMLKTQRFLMRMWHGGSDPWSLLSTSHPVAYADRMRIRPPGDAAFALGPHVDGGSCERWEPNGYGLGGVYNAIFDGRWEDYDAFDGAARLPVVSDLYEGGGACSAFRMYQGWLGLSHTGPNEGTLLVNPLFTRATAYYLLRPFFAPKNKDAKGTDFLSEENWDLETDVRGDTSVDLQGAYPGHGQELDGALHPHLELENTMVSIPKVQPGDYIAWHCDTIHAVDRVHQGKDHASVFYIPACPLTEANAKYLARQRATFVEGTPSPDFPGGTGESEHVGRPDPGNFVESHEFSDEGKMAMGMKTWDLATARKGQERRTMERANEILGL